MYGVTAGSLPHSGHKMKRNCAITKIGVIVYIFWEKNFPIPLTPWWVGHFDFRWVHRQKIKKKKTLRKKVRVLLQIAIFLDFKALCSRHPKMKWSNAYLRHFENETSRPASKDPRLSNSGIKMKNN